MTALPRSKEDYLAVSGRFRPLVLAPGIASFGAWQTMAWNNRGSAQHGARLIPDRAPWRGLFEALDRAGESLPAESVSEIEEAEAIVATCWRYGSYLHALSAGELFPPFRQDPGLSRLSDQEMKRINLEFSSGLAAWWADRDRDPTLVNRRVRASRSLLPMPWATDDPTWESHWARKTAQQCVTDLSPAASRLRVPDVVSQRAEANAIVNWAYRNGPIENLHAGGWSHGTEVPGFVRIQARELDSICRKVAEKLAIYVALRAHPEARQVASAWSLAHRPVGWSEDEETSAVTYGGMPGASSPGPRLRWLAERYPTIYGSLAT